MDHSSTVGFLGIALLLVVCFSASAEVEATPITVEDARKAMTAAKNSAENISRTAQSEIDKANEILPRLNVFDTEAEKAEPMAAEAAEKAAEAVKSNTEAAAIVTNLKTTATTVVILHEKAKEELKKALTILNAVLETANTLIADSTMALVPNDTTENDYTDANKKALEITQNATALETNISEASQMISGVSTIENNMKESWEKTQVETFHVLVIVAVAKIQTLKGNADDIIKQTQNKKDEVDVIVKKMQDLKTKAPSSLMESFEALIHRADGELNNAKSVVENSLSAKTTIDQQKEIADASREIFKKPETTVSTAQEESDKANKCVATVEQKFEQINSALRTATTSLLNANVSKQKMEAHLSTTTTTTEATQNGEETEKANPPVEQATAPDQKDTTTQPKSKDLPDQSDNSADKLKDALSKGAKNVPTTALTSGKAPAPGAKNDSAMTVFVPLLVALIASAVLQ